MDRVLDLDTLEQLLPRPTVGWGLDEESYVRSKLPALIAELRAARKVVEAARDAIECAEGFGVLPARPDDSLSQHLAALKLRVADYEASQK